MRAPRRIVASAPRRMRSRRIRPNTTAEAPPTSTALPSNSPSKKNGLPRTTTSPVRIVPFGMDNELPSAFARDATAGARIRKRARIARLPVMRVERLIRGPASAATRTGVEARGTLSEPPREECEHATRGEQGSGERRPRARCSRERAPVARRAGEPRAGGAREGGDACKRRGEASRRARRHHARPRLERRAGPKRPEGSKEDGETGCEERGRRDGRNAPGPRPADLPGGEGTRSHDPGRELPLEARRRRRHNTLIQKEFHATIPLQLLRSGRQDVLNAGAGALAHLYTSEHG